MSTLEINTWRLGAISTGAALLMISGAAFAQTVDRDTDKGVYANIGVSLLSADLDLSDLDIEGNALDLGEETANLTMITGRLGYRINKYLAVEGDVGFGVGNDDFQRTIPVSINGLGTLNIDADAELKVKNYATVFARGILPVSDKFDLFVRGGYGTAKAEATVIGRTAALAGFSATASEEDSINGFAYGVGAEYHLSDRSGIRLDYSAINSDVQFGSLTYTIKF